MNVRLLGFGLLNDLADSRNAAFLSPAGRGFEMHAQLIEHAHAALIDNVLQTSFGRL